MRALREWLLRLVGTLRPGRGDADLAAELRAHAELAAERGHRVAGASQAMDALRDQRGLPPLDDFVRDVKYGWRALARSKGVTATALVSLALGIGANAGIFTLLDQVLLRPLPVSDPGRLVRMAWRGGAVGANYGSGPTLSYPLCRDLDAHPEIFDGVLCRFPTEVNVSLGGEHEPTQAEIVSGSYFHVLGVRPALGRLLDASDNRQRGAHPVVVVSHDFWSNRLGAARDAVGRRILVNNHPMTIVGIAPAGFRGVDVAGNPDVWVPAMMKREVTPEWDGLDSRRVSWVHAIGRLRTGVTAEQAEARLQPWFKGMLEADLAHEAFPLVSPAQRDRFRASTIEVASAERGIETMSLRLERPLRVLMAGSLLLLVLSSLNVAGLLLARGIARTRELATRMTLGASRARVARQLLVESLLVTAGGGVLGIAAAPLVSRALRSFVPEGAGVTGDIDGRVLLFGVAVSVLTGAICAVAPLFQLRHLHLSAALSERSATMTRRTVRLRKLLVAGQIAFALVLLVTAGLFVQTLARLHAKGPGFSTANLMMFSIDPTSVGHSEQSGELVMREVARRLGELPDVERAAVANSQILNGGAAGGNLTVDAGERRLTGYVYRVRVGPGFFATLGTPLIAGRDFDQRDVRPAGTEPGPYRTAIVNDTFARRYFGDRSPVGARIGAGNRPDTETNIEIIGVVREISRRDMRDLDVEQVFYNFWDNQSENGTFFVRLRGTPESAAASIRSAVAEVDPRLPVRNLTMIDDQIDRALSTERALAILSTGFGALALVISVVGLYGVMSFVATQRRGEIGLRLALGATRRDAVWLVVRDALAMVAVGVFAALPVVWALRRLVEAQLFGVTAFDGPTIAIAAGGLALVALTAATLPAWRASRLNPNAVLRAE